MRPAGPKTTTACEPCRKRKRKCDAKRPICGCCERLGGDCKFTFTDKRRPPTTEQVQRLQGEIEVLQRQLRQAQGTSQEPLKASDQVQEYNAKDEDPVEIPMQALADLAFIPLNDEDMDVSFDDDAQADVISALTVLYADQIESFWQWQADHHPIIDRDSFLKAVAESHDLSSSAFVVQAESQQNCIRKRQRPLRILLLCIAAFGSLHYERWYIVKKQEFSTVSSGMISRERQQEIGLELMKNAQLGIFEEQRNAPDLFTLQALSLCTIWCLGQGEKGQAWMWNCMMVSHYERLRLDKALSPALPSNAQILMRQNVPRIDCLLSLFCGHRRRLIRNIEGTNLYDDLEEARLNTFDQLLNLVTDLVEKVDVEVDSLSNQERYKLLSTSIAKINDFEKGLPRALSLSSDSHLQQVPEIWCCLILHASTILICRPFLIPPSTLTEPLEPSNNSITAHSKDASSLALHQALKASEQMSRLLTRIPLDTPCFTMPYLLAILNNILLASCLSCNPPDKKTNARKSLQQSLSIMRASEKVWKANGKLEESLKLLARKWNLNLPKTNNDERRDVEEGYLEEHNNTPVWMQGFVFNETSFKEQDAFLRSGSQSPYRRCDSA